MADITGASSGTTANSSGSSHVISAPAGSSVGELMVLCTTMTGSQNPAVIDDHPDWVPVTKYRSTASNTTWQAWYYRYKQAGDSSWTITHSGGRGGSSILSMSGTATEDPIDVSSTADHADNTGGTATVTAPSVTSTGPGTLLMSFGLRADLTGAGTLPWSWTTPINTTPHTAANTNTTSTGARNGGHAVFTQVADPAGGGTGPRVSTNNNTGDGVGVQIVVKDLAVAPSSPWKLHTGSGTVVEATLLGIHDGAGGFTPATFVGLSTTSIIFTDDYDRPDEGLEASPDWVCTADPLDIVGNQVVAVGIQSVARWATPLGSGIQFSEGVYEGGRLFGVAVAMPEFAAGTGVNGPGMGSYYVFRHQLDSTGWSIAQHEAGTNTNTVLTADTVDILAGDTIRLEYGDIEGDGVLTLVAYINGVEVGRWTPVDPIIGQNYVGIAMQTAGTPGDPLLSSWTGGTL